MMRKNRLLESQFKSSKKFVDVEDVMYFIENMTQSVRQPKNTIPLFFPKWNKVRDYQWESAFKLCKKSGFLVSPCGSGKTLMALLIASLNGGNFLVLTTRYAEQWRSCLLKYFSFFGSIDLHMYGKESSSRIPSVKSSVIATYCSFSKKPSCIRKRYLRQQMYSTVLLDESHYAASEEYMKLVRSLRLRANYICALTATKVREDQELAKLEDIVGNTTHTIQRQALVRNGYILDVFCSNLIVAYDDAIEDMVGKRVSLCIHPFKMKLLENVSKRLLMSGHKLIVFCDDIFCLYWSGCILRKSLKVDGIISMQTLPNERQKILNDFTTRDEPSVVLLSRTGDEALDIPIASASIVFCNNWASRRQIVQRIGRITRVSNGPPPQFIVLLSDHAKELQISRHREEYMKEHGFLINELRQEDSHFSVDTSSNDHESYRRDLCLALQQRPRT